MVHGPKRLLAILALALSVSLIAACGDDDDDGNGGAAAPEGSFVGQVEGTGAYIALLSDGTNVDGYVCDGKQLGTWLAPTPISDGEATLKDREGNVLGTASFGADGADGEITVDGQSSPFTVQPATGEAGLYRDSSVSAAQLNQALQENDGALPPDDVESGWVVLADGSFKGLKKRGGISTVAGPPPPGGSSLGPGWVDPEPNP